MESISSTTLTPSTPTPANAAADLARDYEEWCELERDVFRDPAEADWAQQRVTETRQSRERAFAAACRRYIKPDEILVVDGVGYLPAGDSIIRLRVVGSFPDVPGSIGSIGPIGPGKDGA